MNKLIGALALLAALILANTAFAQHAHPIAHGDLQISNPMARATPPRASVAGGYLLIKNTGKQSDWLIAGEAGFSDMVEIHEMAVENDVMKMRKLSKGLEIPAGGEVVLKPGGYHIMFMKLKHPLKAGEEYKVTLEFEKSGKIELNFPVIDGGKIGKMMKHKH